MTVESARLRGARVTIMLGGAPDQRERGDLKELGL